VAVVRSSDFLRAPERATALATLIHQRRLTPSCGGHAPTAERTVGPARMIVESLTPRPGIREHNRGNSRHRYSIASRLRMTRIGLSPPPIGALSNGLVHRHCGRRGSFTEGLLRRFYSARLFGQYDAQ
jgi:hypothetical protein